MSTPRRHRYVRLQVAWALGALLALVVLDAVSLGAFVLLTVLGIVVVDELFAPTAVDPRWQRERRRVTAIGLVAAAAVVAVRTIQVLAPGVLP